MKEVKVTREKVISGIVWRFAERIGSQLVAFIVQIVLARVLAKPELNGTITMITAFIAILNVFVASGFGTALMQKKNADELDFSSVFYFQVGFSVVLYVLLWLFAPFIAGFMGGEDLVPLIRVLGLSIIILGINNVQQAYVSKTMQFKRFFFSTLIGTVISGVIGIAMVYMGYGIWALAAQQVINVAVNTIVLYITVRWRPVLKFSFSRLRNMFSFGWKLLTSSLIDTVYNNLYSFIIGGAFSARDLGLYGKAYQFPNTIITNLNAPIQSVLLPALSLEQNNKGKMKAMVRRSIKTSTYLIFPLMAGMAAVATPMVVLILGEAWVECAPMLQICCIWLAFWPIHTANLQAINALGRSDIFLKLEIAKKVIGVALIIITIRFGIYGLLWGKVISGVVSSVLNASPNKKLLNYGYLEQIKDMLPALLLSVFMAFAVWSIELLNLNMYATLGIQLFVGVVIYVVLSKLFKLESFNYLIDIVKKKLKRK